jgi:hypothetical protein
MYKCANQLLASWTCAFDVELEMSHAVHVHKWATMTEDISDNVVSFGSVEGCTAIEDPIMELTVPLDVIIGPIGEGTSTRQDAMMLRPSSALSNTGSTVYCRV